MSEAPGASASERDTLPRTRREERGPAEERDSRISGIRWELRDILYGNGQGKKWNKTEQAVPLILKWKHICTLNTLPINWRSGGGGRGRGLCSRIQTTLPLRY